MFVATVESILIYGYYGWSINAAMERELDITYTGMLMKALNICGSSYITNEQLYGIPAICDKIAIKRLQQAPQFHRHPELSTLNVVLWEPAHSQRGKGTPLTCGDP